MLCSWRPLFLLAAVFNSFLLLHRIHICSILCGICVTVNSELLYAPFQRNHAECSKASIFSSLLSVLKCQHSLQVCRGSPCSTPLCTFNATRLFNIIAGRENEFHQIPISLVLMTSEVEPIVICLFNLLVISLIVSSLEHLNSSWTLCLQCCGSCLNCTPAPSVFRYLPVSMLRKFCFLLRFKMYLKLLVCNAPNSVPSRLCLSDH